MAESSLSVTDYKKRLGRLLVSISPVPQLRVRWRDTAFGAIWTLSDAGTFMKAIPDATLVAQFNARLSPNRLREIANEETRTNWAQRARAIVSAPTKEVSLQVLSWLLSIDANPSLTSTSSFGGTDAISFSLFGPDLAEPIRMALLTAGVATQQLDGKALTLSQWGESLPEGSGGGGGEKSREIFPDELEKAAGTSAAAGAGTTLTTSIYDFLKSKGLHFPRELVTSYLLSLKTKQFVILSGISGTGKTKLAEYVAEWAGTGEREVEGTPPLTPTDDVWQYKVSPYTYRHRKIVVARAFEEQFRLADFGSRPVLISYEGAQYEGTVGKVRTVGRELHELRLGVPLTDRLKKEVPLATLLNIRVIKEIEPSGGEVSIERHSPLPKQREIFVRHDFVSVRPDWLDNKGVLGFFNLLSERYLATPFLKRLIAAFEDEQGDGEPHFITLDEMNLARVEHYFSDLLSVTESRKPDGENVKQEMLHLHDQERCEPILPLEEDERPALCAGCPATLAKMKACGLHPDGIAMVPPKMPVPTNVFITGTVNVDETTHMFSPKVLDRANVIEFNEVRLGGFIDDEDAEFQLAAGALPLRDVMPATSEHYAALSAPIRAQVEVLHGVLEPFHLHFGYRVANEIGLWLMNANEYVGGAQLQTALDLQVLQKVLPKLHGTKQKLFEPLWELLFFASGTSGSKVDFKPELFVPMREALAIGKTLDVATKNPTSTPAPLPRTAKKLLRMVKRLNEQGFVSFIE